MDKIIDGFEKLKPYISRKKEYHFNCIDFLKKFGVSEEIIEIDQYKRAFSIVDHSSYDVEIDYEKKEMTSLPVELGNYLNQLFGNSFQDMKQKQKYW